MTRAPITGSKAHRAWRCPPSVVLPQCTDDDQEESSEPARGFGKAVHRYLELYAAQGPYAALQDASSMLPEEKRPQLVRLVEALDLDNMPIGCAAEVAYAYNWRTGGARELGRGIDRQYDLAAIPPDPTCEIAITLDAVGRAGRRGYVGDYKTGHTKYPTPDRFAQTMIGALCLRATSLDGLDDVVVELLHIHDDGDHHPVRRIVDEWQMDAFEIDFRAAMELIPHWEAEYAAGRPLAYHEGAHCRYCPAFKGCGAKVGLVREIPRELERLGGVVKVADDGGHTLELAPGALNVRNAADAWIAIERMKDLLGRMANEIIGMASIQDIPLPDGRVIGREDKTSRELVGRVAAEVIEKRYGRATALEVMDVSVTLDAARRAAVKHKDPKEKIETRAGDGAFDKLMRDIDAAGGLKVKTTSKISAHAPKRGRLSPGK